MTTILRRLPNVNADSEGLAPINLSQNEIDLMLNKSLLSWWDAGSGYSNGAWRCRKTGRVLSGDLPNYVPPVLQLSNSAYNGAPCLRFGGLSRMSDRGQNLLPASEFSVVFVGRPGPNNNAFMVGGYNTGDSTTTRFVWAGSDASDGSQTLLINGTGGVTNANSHKNSNGAFVQMASHNPTLATNRAAIRTISLTTGTIEDVEGNSSSTANSKTGFRVGAVNGGSLVDGEIASVMIFDKALHSNLSLRSLVESVLKARYSIPNI